LLFFITITIFHYFFYYFYLELGIVGEPAGKNLLVLKTFVATMNDEEDNLLDKLTPEILLKHGHFRSHSMLRKLQQEIREVKEMLREILDVVKELQRHKRTSTDAEFSDYALEDSVKLPANSPSSVGSLGSGRVGGEGPSLKKERGGRGCGAL
jgi:hypothetical protein